jgi:hypothetical protein
LFEQRYTTPRQANVDFALVVVPVFPLNQALRFEPVDQPNCAVMFDLKAFSQLPVCNVIPARETFDGEKGLMLVGSKSDRFGRFLAKF